jgi:hypothetical protein
MMLWLSSLLLTLTLALALALEWTLLWHTRKHIVSPSATSLVSSIPIVITEGWTCRIADANVRGEGSWTAVVARAEVFPSLTGAIVVPTAAESSAVAAAIIGILDA